MTKMIEKIKYNPPYANKIKICESETQYCLEILSILNFNLF